MEKRGEISVGENSANDGVRLSFYKIREELKAGHPDPAVTNGAALYIALYGKRYDMKKEGTKKTMKHRVRKRRRRVLPAATCEECPKRGGCTELCEEVKRRLAPDEALEVMNAYTGRKQEIRLFSELRNGFESRGRPKAAGNRSAISELRYLAGLTRREENLLYMLALGFSQRQIAGIEGVTKQAISKRLKGIVRKAKKSLWGK